MSQTQLNWAFFACKLRITRLLGVPEGGQHVWKNTPIGRGLLLSFPIEKYTTNQVITKKGLSG